MKFYPFCIQCGELITKIDPLIGKGFCDPWCWTGYLNSMDRGSQDDLTPYEDE